MRTKLLLPILTLFLAHTMSAQDYSQYFDGADTSAANSIIIQIDDDSANIWQIGAPQKALFHSAATYPNALMTDTINHYPPGNTSIFQFSVAPWIDWGVLAIQWKQKLDMEPGLDGGKIEFSVDSGITWQNAFNSPHVYNFYGFQSANKDTLPNGDIVFSGTDTTWRDVWLCYDMSWLSMNDSILVRFTFLSDSVNNNKEGWIIDNMIIHQTYQHASVSETKQEKYLNVYPNPANEIINIETQKLRSFHLMEEMVLVNSTGQVIDEWKNVPTKFFINTHKYPDGVYYLKVRTNVRSEVIPIIIRHN